MQIKQTDIKGKLGEQRI